jgi:hypothetical protein
VASKKQYRRNNQIFFDEVRSFASQVFDKFAAHATGDPEDQLKSPVDILLRSYGKVRSKKLILKGESSLEGRLGKPDFAVHEDLLPIGYIELKAPGKGADPELYKGHDREQWGRFKNVPNIIYTDGNEWALYRNGGLIGKLVRFDGDICQKGKSAISSKNVAAVYQLLTDFVEWQPILPQNPKALAAFLAPFCLILREEVRDALKDTASPMHALKSEIKKLLFPDADDFQFADAYAQTVIFALLLAQMEGANVLDLFKAYKTLESHHLLLSRSLQFLTDAQASKEISSSLSLAQRVIHEIPPKTLEQKGGADDPWLFFYEDFLSAYDPKLRKESGVYYTPIEVVRCQIHLIDEILNKHLSREMGFVEAGVATLDPGVGTGTYLLGIIDHAIKRVSSEQGPGAVKSSARSLMINLHGFEWMVGPYAVAQLRFTRALTSYKVSIPLLGPGIYLTNTLESPHTEPPAPPLFHKPIAQEHERSLAIKDKETVLVCLGNPPYGRHEAVTKDNRATTGGWIRHGEELEPHGRPILEDFLEPARKAGYGVHLKNLYNHYIYFIRWSLWKVFEHKTATGPGILSFITASSYIDGDAFVGVREHMRRICDRIDIIDLGGEGRGTRRDENIFAIQTPVAVFVAWRKSKSNKNTPAKVRYVKIEGTRKEKLVILDKIGSEADLNWQDVPSEWQGPFRPKIRKRFFTWPRITDLFPWQQSGAQLKRTWPIAPDPQVLQTRWQTFVDSKDKAELFKETRDRKISKSYTDLNNPSKKLLPLEKCKVGDMVQPCHYSYRSFDRQWILPDNRLGDFSRPVLWQTHSEEQIYLASLFSNPLGEGPALMACSDIPDLDYFRGSYGAKAVMPLFRDKAATQTNILPGLLELLSSTYRKKVSPHDFSGYVYGILAQPAYTSRFADELTNREIRVPITKNTKLFFNTTEYGKYLIWLHTYGMRMTNKDRRKSQIPKGSAKCLKAVSDDEGKYPNEFSYDKSTQILYVGDGQFGQVSEKVYEFEVSGLKVVQSWLSYRMRKRGGRKSSPLDDVRPRVWTYEFTRELLELLWVLEKTIDGYPAQKQLLERVLKSALFTEDELPKVPTAARKAPKPSSDQKKLFE